MAVGYPAFYRHLPMQTGVSLVELVLVIVLSGILAAIVVPLITHPVTGYADVRRRGTLVDAAESAIRRMQRDVRQSLPNSIRIKNGTVLEILHVVDGSRYRFGPDSTNPMADTLDFTALDTSFDVVGVLQNFGKLTPGSDWLVVYNLSATGPVQNAYVGDNRVQLSLAGNFEDHIELSGPGLQFPLSSPQHRFYVVDGPVTFRCNLLSGVLERYSGYPIATAGMQPDPPATTAFPLANKLSVCNFTYNPGSAHRSGLLTISMELSEAGETITLLHQVHIDNSS